MSKTLGLAIGLMMLAGSAGAALAGPDGVWELDSRDTRLQLALCGDGTQLCGALVWLSDADYNKQYEPFLNAPVTNGLKQTGANRWKGAMKMFGQNITGTITQRSETEMTLQACAFLVVCKSYQMFKYAP
ncbi:MAG: DUF2147 domain-containing protein [Alphaproteobacteria bacterium]|nr:DUF2147 domain-containing protein [Alphaproteobacteria bacterium]